MYLSSTCGLLPTLRPARTEPQCKFKGCVARDALDDPRDDLVALLSYSGTLSVPLLKYIFLHFTTCRVLITIIKRIEANTIL
jgi:hypothetical protein